MKLGYIKERKKIKTKEKKPSAETFPKIKFPKEVEFLDELNKSNEKKYKEWLRKMMIIEKLLGKSTLIIGVRAKDGIILGGDRKVMRGGETDFEGKVRKIKVHNAPIIFAAAGMVGIIEDFLETFEKTLFKNIEEGKIASLLSVKLIAENLVESYEMRYAPKFQQSGLLRFVLGGLSELKEGEARLYEIGFPGYGEKIKHYGLIGHGRDYARTIGKYLFPRHSHSGEAFLQCNDIIPRVAACIYWVGGEIDDYVGGDPQIIYILDNKPEVKEGRYNKGKVLKRVCELKKELTKITF